MEEVARKKGWKTKNKIGTDIYIFYIIYFYIIYLGNKYNI